MLKTKRELINGSAGGNLALLTSGIAGDVSGNDGGKGVRRLAGYFMEYYTMWLVPVKRIVVPFWELGKA